MINLKIRSKDFKTIIILRNSLIILSNFKNLIILKSSSCKGLIILKKQNSKDLTIATITYKQYLLLKKINNDNITPLKSLKPKKTISQKIMWLIQIIQIIIQILIVILEQMKQINFQKKLDIKKFLKIKMSMIIKSKKINMVVLMENKICKSFKSLNKTKDKGIER